jgi:hypothetical protein
MQLQAPVQLTQVPPKPTCVLIFNTGSCADLWRNYNQAVQQRTREELQLYVNRQKELASAPLQQQIADLNKLVSDQQGQITKMQEQMQTDSAAALQQAQVASTTALQAKTATHTAGLEQGAGMGVGASLILFVLIVGIKKLMSGFTVTKKPQASAASA